MDLQVNVIPLQGFGIPNPYHRASRGVVSDGDATRTRNAPTEFIRPISNVGSSTGFLFACESPISDIALQFPNRVKLISIKNLSTGLSDFYATDSAQR